MKKFLIFILLLVSKPIWACLYYPFGDDIRISLFGLKNKEIDSYREFNYTAHSFYPEYISTDENEISWQKYCQNKVEIKEITEVLYKLSIDDFHKKSHNKFIQYLYKNGDFAAINYLKFAKEAEVFNMFESSVWEKESDDGNKAKFLKLNIQKVRLENNQFLKRRYAFLGIRIAYYNADKKNLDLLFDSNFKNEINKDIIYYWSLYFKALLESNEELSNFYLAQVFANSPDKRFVTYQAYISKIKPEKVIKYASTNEEKANVYVLAAIYKLDKALNYINEIYKLSPSHGALKFLVQREVNKIEDWILTPKYTLFQSSLFSEENYSYSLIQQRIKRDEFYAKEVIQFVSKIIQNNKNSEGFYELVNAHLKFMSNDYQGALTLSDFVLKNSKLATDVKNQAEIINILALNANQIQGNAILKPQVKSFILKNNKDNQLIFCIARELEYKGNTTEAALLFSCLNKNVNYSYENDYYSNEVYWKNSNDKLETWSNYYSDYFDYLNVRYTPEQVESLIDFVISNNKNKEVFHLYADTILQKQIPRLYDLLGTKFMRQNKLKEAQNAFAKAGIGYWNIYYTNWEREDNRWNQGTNVFDLNPFTEFRYTPKFVEKIEKFPVLNKYTVVSQLIKFIEKAENVKEQDRDYYYFLVGNCYYNMSDYGHCWMMKRFFQSSGRTYTVLEDDEDYYKCLLAKKYYELAYKHSKTDEFKALCLRMAANCEEFSYQNDDYNSSPIKHKNKYEELLFSKYYDNAIHLGQDCYYFEEYFKARRKII